MSNPYEFTQNQFTRRCWVPFWRNLFGTRPWAPKKETPLPEWRYVEQTPVEDQLVAPVDTKIPDALDGKLGKIKLPAPYPGYNCWSVHLPGTPYQVGNSSKYGWIGLKHFNLEYGDNADIRFPRPVDYNGALHREGAPFPSLQAAQGGWADNHICIFDEATGWFYEAIGYNVVFNSVSAYGIFDGSGALVDGKGVIWSKDAIGPRIFDLTDDEPHNLLLVVGSWAGGDTDPPQFPWRGRRLTLSDAGKAKIPDFAPDSPEERFASSVRDYEIIMSDHGGHNSFRWVCGDQDLLRNLDWQGWELHLSDLVPCDGKTGF